ncbi:Hypothetical predicted protein [Olea europaea subsp. europaea]|uniref:Uncharacterized protein n=2 Tax=Olea europaea subsp. europaea TaxID=158383 RepID=A0A8S0QXN1_OLEEU|nr:Hypothetical predicted protein [Olea europaea subsp. europaea]
MTNLVLFVILSLVSITRAEDRAHGLKNESPMALSPQAYAFFHPQNTQPPSSNPPCHSSDCSSLVVSATVKSTPAHESVASGGNRLETSCLAGIPFSFWFTSLVILLCCGHPNLHRANPEQPEAWNVFSN